MLAWNGLYVLVQKVGNAVNPLSFFFCYFFLNLKHVIRMPHFSGSLNLNVALNYSFIISKSNRYIIIAVVKYDLYEIEMDS